MSAWTRLYITVEGHAERKFADDLLRPHLAAFAIDLRSRLVVTNRKLGRRGGILDYASLAGDLARLMREDRQPEARFTTLGEASLANRRAASPQFGSPARRPVSSAPPRTFGRPETP